MFARHTRSRKNRQLTLAVAAAVSACSGWFPSAAVRAVDYTWIPTAGGSYDWGLASNWNPAGPPNSNSDSANLSIAMTGNQTISLGADYTVASLTLGSTGAPVVTHIATTAGANLILEGGAGTASLLSAGVSGAVNQISAAIRLSSLLQLEASSTNDLTISGPITNFGGNRNINNLSGKVLRITGPISLAEAGATAARGISFNRDPSNVIVNFGNIEISGDISDGGFPGGFLGLGPIGLSPLVRSTVTLSGNNTFSGFVNANRVNLVLGSNTALGTGTFFPSSQTGAYGPVIMSNDDARTLANTVQFSQFWIVGGEHSLTFTGPVIQANNRAVTNLLPAGKTLTLNDVYGANSVADNRNFIFDGSGRTIVNGNLLGTSTTSWSGTTGLEKRGTGTVTINGSAAIGTNSYNAGTRVRGGLLEFAQSLAYGNTTGITVEAGGAVGLLTGSTNPAFLSLLANGGGSGPPQNPTASAGALALAPADAAVNLDFVSGNMASPNTQRMGVGAVSGGVTYTGTITPFANTYKLGGGGPITLPNNSQLTGANSVLADNGGEVILTGANNYTGSTTIGGNYINATQVLGQIGIGTSLILTPGSLRVNSTLTVNNLTNGGSPSSIGASSSAAGNLVLNGGTLRYSGAGGSTDRLFTIQPNGATIDASGT
ncbi:MAG TPA: hypothetical protein VNL70_01720, partial [Tepidisphaeraceae bacterium]|nr:hypothetical protein [Tepidisphaeraceae bacterium]